MTNSLLLKMAHWNGEFSHSNLWFSIAMLKYQRVHWLHHEQQPVTTDPLCVPFLPSSHDIVVAVAFFPRSHSPSSGQDPITYNSSPQESEDLLQAGKSTLWCFFIIYDSYVKRKPDTVFDECGVRNCLNHSWNIVKCLWKTVRGCVLAGQEPLRSECQQKRLWMSSRNPFLMYGKKL